MTTFDATVPAAQVGRVAPADAVVRFSGRPPRFWRLLARGAVLLMCTLGIYRFWLTTDIRRFLWSNTELAGESFEYTGTARELLLGFLMAIAILVPLYAAIFVGTLSLGPLGDISGVVLSFALLTVLGQYALYRVRRYRLTRTVYRGVRFHQTGSAWHYAICCVFWWCMIIPTLGFLYPFGQSQLERFKMHNTFFSATYPGASAAWLLLSFALFYPIFQAMVLRWWASGLRFGEVVVTSRLRTAQVYGVYARFLLYAFVFTMAAGVIVVPGMFMLETLTQPLDSMAQETITTIAGLVAYVAIALGYAAIYQATVRLGLWRCLVESLDIANLVVLEQVAAVGQPASPVGEGLADALSMGGI